MSNCERFDKIEIEFKDNEEYSETIENVLDQVEQHGFTSGEGWSMKDRVEYAQ